MVARDIEIDHTGKVLQAREVSDVEVTRAQRSRPCDARARNIHLIARHASREIRLQKSHKISVRNSNKLRLRASKSQ